MPKPRTMFLDMPTKGKEANAALFKAYKDYIEKEGGTLSLAMEEEGSVKLPEGDWNWVKMYMKLNESYNYPPNDELWDLYRSWYAACDGSHRTEQARKAFMKTFREVANEHDAANNGKDFNQAYLRTKMKKLLDVVEEKTGRKLPNPAGHKSANVSAEDAVGNDFGWMDD